MISVQKTIRFNSLFEPSDIVGVGVSGGIDSMSLLHYLNENKAKYQIELMAICVNHQLRESSEKEVQFVKDYCKKHHIKFQKFEVDVKEIAENDKLTIEEAARKARYGVFDALISKGIVTKVCLGHHQSDQAETVLLNLFRGSGLGGARGMDIVRGAYVRPFLYTTKAEIEEYAKQNNIPYMVDESNLNNEYSRNFIRNQIMPLIKERFPSVENNLVQFARIVQQDDDYITNMMNIDGIIKEEYYVKVPVSYFLYSESIVNRMLKYCFEYLGVYRNIERKHIDMIKEMVKDAVNGIKISLPNKITVHKEYDYVTIVSKEKKYGFESEKLKSGVMTLRSFGTITIKRTYEIDVTEKDHVVDVTKVPTTAIWRTRREGDVFTKFGGGTKKLKEYLIDKKVPSRIRDAVPVLAIGNEVLIVAGYDISEKVKVDESTKSAYVIKYNMKY